MKVSYQTMILKFDNKGEKTGWSYIVVPADIAQKINKGVRKSFTVKGTFDSYAYHGVSVLPMGDGSFIIPFNATFRKAVGKRVGAIIIVTIEKDNAIYKMNTDFMACLHDSEVATAHFNVLSASHQKYFSKWIDAAKTDATRVKRITLAINMLANGKGFGDVLRTQSANKKQ